MDTFPGATIGAIGPADPPGGRRRVGHLIHAKTTASSGGHGGSGAEARQPYLILPKPFPLPWPPPWEKPRPLAADEMAADEMLAPTPPPLPLVIFGPWSVPVAVPSTTVWASAVAEAQDD